MKQLTDNQICEIAEKMPGGLDGFMKGWGWVQFARAIIRASAEPDNSIVYFDYLMNKIEELNTQLVETQFKLKKQRRKLAYEKSRIKDYKQHMDELLATNGSFDEPIPRDMEWMVPFDGAK